MLSWLYNKKVEDEIIEEEEVEEDFLKSLIYEDDNVKYYSSDVRDFIPNIKLWSSQRSINSKHVEELVKCLQKKNHFIGTFKLVRDKENNIRLIDGQHRYEAIKKIMKNDSSYNMNVIIELYETDFNDSDYTINLFKDANSCLNVKETDLPNIIVNKIIKKLCEKFPNMIFDISDGKRCNRPRINKRELYLNLKNYVHKTHKTEDDIFEEILRKNNSYGIRSRQTFKNVTKIMYDKCKESGLYLGLDLHFEWINDIELDLE
jgi:hypothetical protein